MPTRNISTTLNPDVKYDPRKHGAVVAIRIFMAENGYQPMAEIKMAYNNNSVTINWDVPAEREPYYAGINAYTLWYDERPKRAFEKW